MPLYPLSHILPKDCFVHREVTQEVFFPLERDELYRFVSFPANGKEPSFSLPHLAIRLQIPAFQNPFPQQSGDLP